MEVSPITGIPTSASSRARTSLTDDFDDFLTLLTAQLAHQDPLDPVDSNEFVAQLVSFTGVEQAVNTNSNLERLISLFEANRMAAAVGYIGATVEANGDTSMLTNGKASFNYSLFETASTTSILIDDDQGETVFTGQGDASAGDHTFAWDGRNNDGVSQPDGVYRIRISAKNADGTGVPVDTRIVGRVTRVETLDDQIVLTVNGASVPFDNVLSVRESKPSAAAP